MSVTVAREAAQLLLACAITGVAGYLLAVWLAL